MREDNQSNFPRNFLWGASTSSHQVEGGTVNQWSVWELANAKELAQTAHQRLGKLSDWDNVKSKAEDPANYVSGRAVDHYHKYKEDFELAKSINFNAFRFSIEWSRLEPKEGAWDEKEIEHYRKYIAELRARRLEPFLNVWHWTMPIWFTEKGGFEKTSNIKYFERFVEKIADELIEEVSYVITINEPNVYSTFSYLTGEWPPEKKNLVAFVRVALNLVKAHKKAYKILKTKKPSLSIGVASQLANIQAKRPHNFFDEVSTKYMRYFWNWWFLIRIRRKQDFIGINYYNTDYYTGLMKLKDPLVPLSDLGWYMEPEGLYPILLRAWSRYHKPIFVTENGVADSDDKYRRWWLEETIVAMEKAISEGVHLQGYFHWSLVDNFEWKYGWWPKFGLFEVDRSDNMKRKARPSAKWLADRISKL
ncbi:MAG TPA: glycoside hydrolase family 1 protein [Candidatus Saccharimonadales bacterium]|nr:glycoside hydrolase family 1 protein [Candidatus Saccharimonadales bacterium]